MKTFELIQMCKKGVFLSLYANTFIDRCARCGLGFYEHSSNSVIVKTSNAKLVKRFGEARVGLLVTQYTRLIPREARVEKSYWDTLRDWWSGL